MLQRLTLLWRTFTPVEEQILGLLGKALPAAHRGLYHSQVNSINKVQRTLEWTEILFYCMKSGKVRWNPDHFFPNRGEFKVGSVDYVIKGVHFTTTLTSIAGHIFSFVTRPSIKPHCFDQIDEVRSVKIIGDPADRNVEIAINVGYLPDEYRRYIESGAPLEVNGWHLLTPQEVYPVPLPAGDFLILAVRQGEEYLMTPDETDDVGIYFTRVGDTTVHRQRGSFREILAGRPAKSSAG